MNKNLFALIVLFVGICISSAIGISISNRSVQFCPGSDGNVGISVRFNSYEEVINPYYCVRENTFYYFLPSALCGKEVYNDSYDAELYIDDRKIDKHTKFEWEDDVTYKLKNADTEIMARFMVSSDLPALFISTDTGNMEQLNSDKSYSERGKIDIIEADGSISYSGGLSLKGRGNSTYYMSFDKKPFNIKLDDAAGILGMNMDKDWVLLANSWDYSYMNNKLAFDMASKAGFSYVPEAEYADVYFNGDYWGIYLVAEKVEVDENRIDITDLKQKNQEANPDIDISAAETFDYGSKRGVFLDNVPDDITGGYLLEKDYRLRPDYKSRVMTTSYFETPDFGTCINIKSPEYASEEEVDYICNLTNKMEQAITSPDGYSRSGEYYLDYIDLDSWVKWYMIAEIAYDLDKDGTNTYFYKDRDVLDTKFHVGPTWDYDCRFGGTKQYASAEILTKLERPGSWTKCLYEKPEFFNAVCHEWNAYFKDYLREDAQKNIDLWQEQISQSVKMDNVRWYRGDGYVILWPTDDGVFIAEYDFNDEVDHLRNWVSARCDFLDTCWGKEE